MRVKDRAKCCAGLGPGKAGSLKVWHLSRALLVRRITWLNEWHVALGWWWWWWWWCFLICQWCLSLPMPMAQQGYHLLFVRSLDATVYNGYFAKSEWERQIKFYDYWESSRTRMAGSSLLLQRQILMTPWLGGWGGGMGPAQFKLWPGYAMGQHSWSSDYAWTS